MQRLNPRRKPQQSAQRGSWRALSWVPSLYFAEGLPYVVVMTVAGIMYKCLEVSNTEIALYTAWLYLPWVVKPLWSPFVDIFGTKRRWILWMEWGLAASLAGVGLTIPLPGFLAWTLTMFWLMAFISATHDIAADGFYMLGLPEREQAALVGVRTLFYRLAMIAGQGGVVVIAGYVARVRPMAQAWQWAMAALATLFVLLALWHSFALPRPGSDRREEAAGERLTVRTVLREFWATVTSFFAKPGIGVALLFMLLYRFPEAQLVKLIGPFLLDSHAAGGLQLPTEQVGMAYGTFGIAALIVGGIVGGLIVAAKGLRRCMMPMALAMSLTCATFVYLSYTPASPLWVVYLCVALEQLGYGFGTTAYTLYLINFSHGARSTSHYAICTGLMALGMMLPGMAAGWLQELLGYQAFFIYTLGACAITLAVTAAARRPLRSLR
ncbi:MAG: MFS transporter [Candidatus Amulumruptor caecigallinarius]|nr:MFS transporter [Candidatus Amulumruptor caecigallinarius]MCM1396797.1 MFS transporter [Candidatus Amulumruptor caecigallinarius]MCM1454508.1 MFS transporter [bacterium]